MKKKKKLLTRHLYFVIIYLKGLTVFVFAGQTIYASTSQKKKKKIEYILERSSTYSIDRAK